MITLDEAIKHAEEVAEENERICKVIPEHSANAFHCAEEHRQLAKWLKELKELKQTNTAEWKETLMGNGEYRYLCSRCNALSLYAKEKCDNCGCRMKGDIE